MTFQFDDLRDKTKQVLPAMKKQEPKGRSEFASVRELVNYLIDEDQRAKSERKRSS